MKRVYIAVTVLLCMLLSGCAFWMDGEYLSVTPHQERISQSRGEVIQVSNSAEMKKTLETLVELGMDSGILTASAFPRNSLRYYADSAVKDVLENNPVATYAVKNITFEIGTNSGEPVIAFHIDYLHGRAEILRIKRAQDMNEAANVIYSALANYEASLVFRVDKYEMTDFAQLIQDYGNNNPDLVMEIPQVRAHVYPEKGNDRVVEIYFTYQNSREKLRQMKTIVEPIFTSAELYVAETAQANEVLSRLYTFLMERNKYTIQTSITPAYSLLHHGVGDSRAFANVYAKMCRHANIDCRAVTGSYEGRPWVWNVVRYRGKYYHIDLLSSKEGGKLALMDPADMDGYVWDYAVYPQE